MDKKNEQNNGGYSMEDIIWHQHSNRLLIKIMELWPLKDRPIIDIGCGHNFYMNVLRLLGYRGRGYDIIPFPGVHQIDITHPGLVDEIKSVYHTANVLSLEVGEHIPPHLANDYLDNITKFHGDIILSWAVPGQPGIGHINCQSNEWVTSRMYGRGYQLHHDKTAELRECVREDHCTWFRNTLMYFTPKQ